jgi:predicted acyltransferase
MNKQRLLSLDIFRGATIAAMILVNNPGSWSHVYSPLLHAEWHGATVTDWIFPFFIFIVGVAIAYALGKRKQQGTERKALVRKILIRSAIIFGIGLFLNAFPFFNLSTVRIPGVLQRIALVYGVTALLFLYQTPQQLFYFGLACLLGYWALLTLVPVPGGGAPSLAPSENLGAWLDRTLMEGHLWSQSKTWDPEGLLSTLPAFGTSISGILTGLWLRKPLKDADKVAALMVVGTLLLGVSLIWDLAFPINKKIWTSSYVLYTSGIAMLLLGVIYWLVDMKGYRAWTPPFVVYGTNALFVFVLSGVVAKILYTVKWTDSSGEVTSAKAWLAQMVFDPLFVSPYKASLAFAIANVLFFWLLSWILYRRKIFIKV